MYMVFMNSEQMSRQNCLYFAGSLNGSSKKARTFALPLQKVFCS